MGFQFRGTRFFGGGDEAAEQGSGVGSKLEKIKAHLKRLADKQGRAQGAALPPHEVGGAPRQQETIADDGGIPADRAEGIRRDEALVRDALGLFGVDYDGLIRMGKQGEGDSVYAKAVQANPAVVAEVAKAAQPVLAALKVAVGYKPYADFTDKYGSTPEEIKTALKAELAAQGEGSDPVRVAKPVGPVFSTRAGQRASAVPVSRKHGLKDVFGK